MFREGKDSGGPAVQGESHPGVRPCESVNGGAGVVGKIMRKPRSGERGEACSELFSPRVGLRPSLWENPSWMVGLRVREGSGPSSSDGNVGRRRVNGNQRCSPLRPAEEFCDTSE